MGFRRLDQEEAMLKRAILGVALRDGLAVLQCHNLTSQSQHIPLREAIWMILKAGKPRDGTFRCQLPLQASYAACV